MRDPLERIAAGEILLFDGAIGTMIMARGLQPGRPPESFNLSRPEVLEEVARLYIEAGAEFVTTNTFGASPIKLRHYGQDNEAEMINTAGVEAARAAAEGRAYVAASIGPTGAILRPYGDAEPEEVYDGFKLQAAAMAAAGADIFVVETMIDLAEAKLAVKAARDAAPRIPVMATMTFDPTPRGYFTVMGVTVAQAADGLAAAGADIVGSNCGNGIERMIEIAVEFKNHTKMPIAIQSNAGLPITRDGEVVYPETPEFMAYKANELINLPVSIIGGCCGTTPKHVRSIRAVIDSAR
ncbi:MAG TPA: homocysteine S-methyltransferase family protein [Acidobacteriota bacterium]|nr:homocysteine S-methyltransferase family protein [Acidobacteriota bacterium]